MAWVALILLPLTTQAARSDPEAACLCLCLAGEGGCLRVLESQSQGTLRL